MTIQNNSVCVFFFCPNFILSFGSIFFGCKENEMQCNPSQFHLHWTVEVLQVPGFVGLLCWMKEFHIKLILYAKRVRPTMTVRNKYLTYFVAHTKPKTKNKMKKAEKKKKTYRRTSSNECVLVCACLFFVSFIYYYYIVHFRCYQQHDFIIIIIFFALPSVVFVRFLCLSLSPSFGFIVL